LVLFFYLPKLRFGLCRAQRGRYMILTLVSRMPAA